jgi:hypothetical protein
MVQVTILEKNYGLFRTFVKQILTIMRGEKRELCLNRRRHSATAAFFTVDVFRNNYDFASAAFRNVWL